MLSIKTVPVTTYRKIADNVTFLLFNVVLSARMEKGKQAKNDRRSFGLGPRPLSDLRTDRKTTRLGVERS